MRALSLGRVVLLFPSLDLYTSVRDRKNAEGNFAHFWYTVLSLSQNFASRILKCSVWYFPSEETLLVFQYSDVSQNQKNMICRKVLYLTR